jgi:hypothetical protein
MTKGVPVTESARLKMVGGQRLRRAMEKRPRDTIDDTLDWLAERKENCLRILQQKTGDDREGWIDDAAKFGHAISLIRRAYR